MLTKGVPQLHYPKKEENHRHLMLSAMWSLEDAEGSVI